MKGNTTEGTICLKDDYGIEYKIATISYTEMEDESFRYTFRPFYEVIDMIGPEIFQGIPGLDLNARNKEYIRENLIPTFISERSPGKNRENLWEMLDRVGMTYLNQLEWLIRTDTQYSGDRLYVKRYSENDEKHTVFIELDQARATDACKDILNVICYGNEVAGKDFKIDDTNRKDIYKVLYHIYCNETDSRRRRINEGIKSGAAQGHYRGRRKKALSTPKLYEINDALKAHKITEEEAMKILNISRATLYRRLKEIR